LARLIFEPSIGPVFNAKNNYAIAIAVLSNSLLKYHADFSTNEKQNRTQLALAIFPAL